MRLKHATYTIEYENGETTKLDTVDKLKEAVTKLDNNHDEISYTLVYQCQKDNHTYAEHNHEFPEQADSWQEIDTYAIEDADPCELCRGDYAIINSVVLDRIETNHGDTDIKTIQINY
jgi:hypothetical protein